MPRRITATSAKAQDASASFNQIRAAFMQRASAPNVAPFALKLAYVIAFKYMNRETQTARPAQETLARDLNVTSRTIRTLLDILEPLGLTIIPGHGPNRASSYCLDPDKISNRKPEPENRKPASAYNRKPASASKSNTGKSVHDNRKLDDSKTGSQLPPNLTKRTKVRTKKGRKTLPPSVAALGENKQADDAFDRFWAVYPKHDSEARARKEFARAIVDTDPEIIITGAQRYALAEQMRLARPGQTAQHTAMAHNWLRDQRWNDPAPPGAVLDNETGNVVAIATAAPARKKTETWMETAERRQREREAGLRP